LRGFFKAPRDQDTAGKSKYNAEIASTKKKKLASRQVEKQSDRFARDKKEEVRSQLHPTGRDEQVPKSASIRHGESKKRRPADDHIDTLYAVLKRDHSGGGLPALRGGRGSGNAPTQEFGCQAEVNLFQDGRKRRNLRRRRYPRRAVEWRTKKNSLDDTRFKSDGRIPAENLGGKGVIFGVKSRRREGTHPARFTIPSP